MASMMIALLPLTALLAGGAPAMTAEAALARSRAMTTTDACAGVRDTDDIVVCGRRGGDGYRLPVDTALPGGAVAGEVPSSSPNRFIAGGCGVFAGQRPCASKAELDEMMAGGKNPLTILRMLGTRLLDPDADTAPPVEYPKPR